MRTLERTRRHHALPRCESRSHASKFPFEKFETLLTRSALQPLCRYSLPLTPAAAGTTMDRFPAPTSRQSTSWCMVTKPSRNNCPCLDRCAWSFIHSRHCRALHCHRGLNDLRQGHGMSRTHTCIMVYGYTDTFTLRRTCSRSLGSPRRRTPVRCPSPWSPGQSRLPLG